MQRNLVPKCFLVIYSVLVIKLAVFRIEAIKTRWVTVNVTDSSTDGANYILFKTILPYLRGEPSWSVAFVNIVGNIALFVPIGFVIVLIYRTTAWKKFLMLSVFIGLTLETMQAILHTGIFDIDDVLLNGLGVMIGYWLFVLFSRRYNPSNLQSEDSRTPHTN